MTRRTAYDVNFKDLLFRFNFQQHVKGATHEKGHTLDLIITRGSSDPVSDLLIHAPSIDSDHFPITCKLKIKKAECHRKIVSYKKTKNINIDKLREDIVNSNLRGNKQEHRR